MRRTIATIGVVMLGLMAGLAPAPAAAQGGGAPEAAPGELLVRFASGTGADERAQARGRAEVDFDSSLPVRGLQVVETEAGQTTAAAERALEQSPDVLYAEPNFYRRVSLRPSDPSFRLQWGFENTGQIINRSGGLAGADVNAVAAWDITTGSPNTVVAVVDSGVSAHPDLAGSGWTNPAETANGVDDDRNGLVDDTRGWDWRGADADPNDENGHGTHVAGTVGARANNARGVVGTSWRTRLMALRALGADGTGTVADVVRAYRYAAAKGVRVVNASLGSPSFSASERDAIAAAPNVLFVVAAGNGGADGIGDNNDVVPEYPCAYPLPNVVCVASTGRRDILSPFSNYGLTSVDLAAPGEEILSTWTAGRYVYSDGTSMATPHVAGTASLLLAVRPTLTVAQLRSALLGGVDRLPSLTGRVASGGRLDMRRSLELATGGAASGTQPPAAPAPQPAAPSPPAPPATPPAPAVDRDAPSLTVKAKRRVDLRRALRRGVVARISCSERCSLRVRLLISSRQARRARLSPTRRTVAIGAVRVSDTSGPRLRVRVKRRVRARLSRLRSVRVTLEVRGQDASGNARVVRRRALLVR